MKKQHGFTLIELMIVVAIIGILAAIAIPAYQDYIARSQVSEPVQLLSGGKTALAEFYADKGQWPLTASSVMGTVRGKYTSVITISAGSALSSLSMTLEATLKTTGVNKNIQASTVTLSTIDGGKIWGCRGGSVGQKFRPGACK